MTRITVAAAGIATMLFVAGASPVASQTTFSDGTFASADWTFVEVDTNEGGTVTAAVVADGNPGDALRITIVKNAAAGFSAIYGVWLWKIPYDPTVSGGFASVDHSEDARAIQAIGNGHATGVALRQGGTIYIHRVAFTPERAWTPKREMGIVAGAFSRLAGPSRALDFGPGAEPIEVGFYRADSHPASGGSQGTRIIDIDNWSVTLVPPCTSASDCNDADACTLDTCVAGVCARSPVDCSDGDGCTEDRCTDGVCTNPPRNCDDGNDCTADSCTAGACQNPVSASFETVDARLTTLLARIENSPCGAEDLVRKVVRKLRKQLAKARAKLANADRATRDKKVLALVAKAQALLGAARTYIGVAVRRNLVSPACATTLNGLVGEVELCIGGLPLPQSTRSVPDVPRSRMRRHTPAMVAPASSGSSPAGRTFETHLRSASVVAGPGRKVR